VTANCGPVGVVSILSEPLVNGGFASVADMSIDGGGGCRRDVRNSESNLEARLPNEAPLCELRCSPDREV
jgi:hypothetical protein